MVPSQMEWQSRWGLGPRGGLTLAQDTPRQEHPGVDLSTATPMLLSTSVGPAVPGGGRQQQWASPHWSHIWKGRLGCSCRLSERLPPGAGQRQKRMSCRGFSGLRCYLNRAQTLRTSQPLPKPQPQTWKPTYSFSTKLTVFLPGSIPLNSHLLTGSGRGLEEGDMLQLPEKLRDSKQPKAGPRDGQIPQRNRGRKGAEGSKEPSHHIRAGVRGGTKEGLRET